jgi:hypothetical protein
MIGGRTQECHGTPILLLGLTHKNLDHLREGKPISLKPYKHPFIPAKMGILLFAGLTEASMMLRLESLVLTSDR